MPWKWPVARQCWLLFALGFVARAGLAIASHQYRDLQQYELQRAAYSLATTGVLGNPYAIETGPTAHVSPGYPLILAGIYRVLGRGEQGELVKELLASAVSAAGWALVPMAGASLGMAPAIGFLAGLLGAALPLKLSIETKGDWEAPYAALATMLLACMTALLWKRRTFTSREAASTGAAWGVSLLFVSALLPSFLAFAAAGFVRCPVRQYLRFAAVQVFFVAIFLAPWILRNWKALGEPIATRSNFGLELRLSNNDLAGPLERDNYLQGVYHVYHPLQNAELAARVRAEGEPEFNREAMREGIAWIETHPARFFQLTAERVFYFWLQPVPGQFGKAFWLGIMGVLGLVGWCFLAAEDFWAALPMGLFLLILPLPNYLVHVGLRHRYPLDWMCWLLAVYLVWRVAGRRFEGLTPKSVADRVIL